MIIVFTNRSLRRSATGSGGADLFGDSQNTEGSSELRIAVAQKVEATGAWRLDLQEEPQDRTELPSQLPSQLLFRSVLERIRVGSMGPRWVVAVHGYGQSFLDSLEEAYGLQQRYHGSELDQQVNVILFSWPSKPGGIVLDPVNAYRRAQAAAVPSAAALAIVLQRVWDFLAVPALSGTPIRKFTLGLYAHSQGNLLLEMVTRTKALVGSPIRFDTIILHQADVDAHDHLDWVDRMTFGSDVLITLNAFDSILRLSDAINPERLGIARSGFQARATYFDFTGGSRVGSEHNLFLDVENQVVQLFCHRALTGYPVHEMGGAPNGFWWDEALGTWRLGVRPSPTVRPVAGARR